MKLKVLWQIIFFLVFAGYMFVWVMLPTNTYKFTWLPKLNEKLNSTYFREQGTNLLLFSFPIMFISTLGCVYLHFKKKSISESSNNHCVPMKRPAMVRAPLGIVNGIELTFAAMFIALLIWSLANYIYVGFNNLHMHPRPGVAEWQVKFRSVSLRLGYIGNTCWAFLFFPVTRGSSLLPLVGLTSESSIKYHIWLGRLSNVLFAAHSIGFVIYWWFMSHEMNLMVEWSSTYVSNLAGVIAFVVSLGIWATSFNRIRRKFFEVFFYAHHLYILYVFFYILHVGVAYFCMILPGIFLFLIDRYLRFLQSRRRVRVFSTRLLPNGTMELTFSKNPGLSYNPTSILFVQVPSICKLQWHPFTIISNSNLEADKLSIIIKTEGSWTQKLYKQLSSSLDHLQVSTEGPYGPTSSHFLSRESLVMICGGSGIAPFISIIREIIHRSTQPNRSQVPKILLVTAFKNTVDLTMLDLLLPIYGNSIDMSKVQLQIEAYITRENDQKPLENTHKLIQTNLFKQNPSDSPLSAVLGKNSWLWLAAIISSSFVMFLLFLGIITRYHIYPVEQRGENYHYSLKILWDIFLVMACVFLSTSVVFVLQKREYSMQEKQVENVAMPTPTSSPSSWFCPTEREVESLPHQSLVQCTNVHFGARPDLKRILFDCKESDVGVLVCGPKSLRHEVAKICASALAQNLHFESISFSW